MAGASLPVDGAVKIHPKWGYDIHKVKGVHCLSCDKKIGRRKYVEDTAFARFGEMMFWHKTCWDRAEAIDKKRKARKCKRKKSET